MPLYFLVNTAILFRTWKIIRILQNRDVYILCNNWAILISSFCNLVYCAAPRNGINTKTVDASMTIPEGVEYTYECVEGSNTTDNLTTVCTANGSWTNPPPICTCK